jgi:predicted Zn-dependent protease
MKSPKFGLLVVLAVALLPTPSPSLAFDFKSIDLNKLRDVGEKLKPLKKTSENDEIELGKDVAANLLGAAPLVNDPALQDYVNKVGMWVALHTERPNLPWHFGVMDTDTVNAFATPGGYVFITRGMLLHLRDEAELAGVLAHEVSHVIARHALNTMRKDALAGLAGDALGEYAKDKGGAGYAKLVSASTEVYSRGLDKDDEFAADRMGVVMAARSGYDPYALASVLQTLSSINPKDDSMALMFKTHPDPTKRLELLMAVMEGNVDQYADQPKVEDRFSQIMKTHVSYYSVHKK